MTQQGSSPISHENAACEPVAGTVAEETATSTVPAGDGAALPPETTASPGYVRLLWMLLLSLPLLWPILVLSPLAARSLGRAQSAIEHSWYQMDNEEGALLFQAQEMAQGRSIYHALDSEPFVVGTYPPLYMLAASVFADASNPTFAPGRVISLGACLAIAGVLALVLLLRYKNPIVALLAALMFLASFEVYSWIPYYRVDFLAIGFSLAGLACVALWPKHRAALLGSVLLFTAGAYTKQTELAAPLACVLALFFQDRRVALRYVLGLMAAFVLPMAVLSALTRGEFFRHTVLYNMNSYHPELLRLWGRHAWLFSRWLIVASIAGTGTFFKRGQAPFQTGTGTFQNGDRHLSKRCLSPFCCCDPLAWFVLTSLVHFVTIAKAGTAENYLLEPVAAFCLGSCAALASLLEEGTQPGLAIRHRLERLLPAAAIMVCLLAHGSRVSALSPIMFSPARNPQAMDFAAAGEVARIVRSEPSGASWSELGIFNLLAGRSIVFQPFIMSELARQGRWNPEPFYAALRAGKYKLVVTCLDVATTSESEVYTPEMLKILRERYNKVRELGGGAIWNYYVYRLK